MQIGKGPLELGIIGISYNEELSVPKLEELTKSTLNICPLGDIFHLDDIDIIKIPLKTIFSDLVERLKVNNIRLEKNLDAIAIINKNVFSRCNPFTELIYSRMDPSTLAHELGHALGLNHPSPRCYPCNGKSSEDCPFFGYIMGCKVDGKRRESFSPENLERLEGWYLKCK